MVGQKKIQPNPTHHISPTQLDPIHHDESKKIQPNPTHHISPTQPNPTHMGWVKPMDWTILLLLNWVEKKYKYEYIKKKTPKISINVTP